MALGCINSVISFLIQILAEKGVIVYLIVISLPTINGYIIYQVYKMIKSCRRYHKRNYLVANRNQEEDHQPLVGNDDDWIADRMENPLEYDEQHVPGRMDDALEKDRQPIATTAATYGSIN
uniref:Uncharacterized protein n=1 Tax=Amphimedon queenslandica TaxID=400682 RepID=A0A1X7SYT6_AMPQE